MKHLKYILLVVLVNGSVGIAFTQTYVHHTYTQAAQFVADAGQAMDFCAGDTVAIGGNPTTSGGTSPISYLWSPGAGLNSTTVSNPAASPSGTTTYSLQATDAENCTSTASVTLTLTTATAAFTSSANLLMVTFTDQSTNATSWAWDFGDGGTSTQQNPTHGYAVAGTYQVCLTINAGAGCEQTLCDSVNVVAVGVVNALPGYTVQVYPNPSTGSQVHFEITGAALSGTVEIELFDLQGRQVLRYEGSAAQTIHTMGRRELAAGTYQYRVQAGDEVLGSGKVVFE